METSNNPIENGSCREASLSQDPWDLYDKVLSLDLVSAFAGDRPLTDEENAMVNCRKKERRERFFSDLLFTITNQYFPPKLALEMWEEILHHKYTMSSVLKRNIRITVASLDYLSNLKGELHSPIVIDETRITGIVELSLRDGLTKLYNHSTRYHRIDEEITRFNRYGTPFSIMMIDMDDFKKTNDQFGHVEGDRILSLIGMILKDKTRLGDISCRYGGEEFLIILPSTELNDAGILAERIRMSVEQNLLPERKLTVSIGVSSYNKKLQTTHALIERADSALYAVKNSGKNAVLVCIESEELESFRKSDIPFMVV